MKKANKKKKMNQDPLIIEENKTPEGRKYCGFYIDEDLDAKITKIAESKKQHKRVVYSRFILYGLEHLG